MGTEEVPGWLWWLLMGLAAFLLLLAVLVYRNWAKSRRTGAILTATQQEIDAELEIDENGWQAGLDPSMIAFNPLATGFHGNATDGDVGPTAPLNGGSGMHNFVRPNIQKAVYREEYGPNTGNIR